MSETKHTKGPWELDSTVHNGTDYGFCGVRTCSDEGYAYGRGSYTRIIAQTPHALRMDNSELEVRANMALIAAAPDLLFLVKWMVNNPGECLGDHGNIERQATEILAKAEGLQ